MHNITKFCIVTIWGYLYSKSYVCYFSQIFQGLGLFRIQDYQQYSLLHETLFEDQAEDVCSLASAIGPCRAAVPRFFFNGDSGWFFLSD